jgi:nucleoside-diphosphate-sugar epimerase
MRILLTGASGYLGSALAQRLHAAGHQLCLPLRASSSLRRLTNVALQAAVCRYDSHIDLAALVAQFAPQCVVHTACSYGRNGETLLQLHEANVTLGLALIQVVQSLPHAVTFINTGTALGPDVSAYALGKQQFAQWGKWAATQSNGQLQFINVVLQHFYGPHDEATKFLTHALRACLAHQPTLALTAGEQHRDFIDIADVLSAYELILAKAGQLSAECNIELGSGQAPPLRDTVQLLHRLTGSHTRLDFGAVPYRSGEAMHCCADLSRLRELGWQPAYDLNTGIAALIAQETTP